jgi:hypothetical protein
MPAGELVMQFECVGDTIAVSDQMYGINLVNPTPKFVPSHVGGDCDFGGHGPQVGVSATLSVQNQTDLTPVRDVNSRISCAANSMVLRKGSPKVAQCAFLT